MNKTIINDRTGFEVYLEGIKAQPASITIRENEGGFPTANLSYPATSAIFRILPGTVVQIFGPDPLTNKQILLFEGQITAINYQKSGTSRSAAFNCKSFLNDWTEANTRAKDAFIMPDYREAIGQSSIKYKNLTETDENKRSSEPNSLVYKDLTSTIKNKIGQEVSGDLDNILNNIDFTEFSAWADEFSLLLNDTKVASGDLHFFIQFMLRKFEEKSPFYGITANSYGIAESILGLPNKGKIDPFKRSAVMQNTFKIIQEMQQPFSNNGLNLFVAIRQMLKTFNYTLVSPAHYTGSYRFWSKDYTTKKPVRSYLMPNLENSPPAKFNLFFPHQVSSISYARSFDKEATRTIGELDVPVELAGSAGIAGSITGVAGIVTEPNLNITSDGMSKNQVGFTLEETYRGIRANHVPISGFFSEVVNDKEGNSKSIDENEANNTLEESKSAMAQLTLTEHVRERMNSRSLTIQATWSPYRMTGIPAAFIEDGDGPSITGVISAISTNISASGRVSSTITLRSPRMVQSKEDLRDNSDDEQLINEFSLDPYIDVIDYLFDKELYSFENIGKIVYTYLKAGKLSSTNNTLKEYAGEGDKGVFTDYGAALDALRSQEYSSPEDSSIIDFIRNKDGVRENLLGTDLELTTGSAYTRDVYESIYAVQDLYKSFDDKGSFIDKWTNEITHREVISKREYFNSLSVFDPESEDNCKDGMELFLGTENLDNAKKAINDNPEKTPLMNPDDPLTEGQISRLVTSKKNYEEDVKELDVYLSSVTTQDVGRYSRSKLVSISKLSKTIPAGVNITEEAFPITKDTLEWAKTSLLALIKDVDKKLKGIPQEDIDSAIETAEGFEYELFKPYNLTRRRHVLAAMKKYTKHTLKSDNNNSTSDIRQNLTILK